jgi:acyl-CoA synthetase (AMP-forming)/AMP-acid ligase II
VSALELRSDQRKIAFIDALPTNPTGKVLKHELAARFVEKATSTDARLSDRTG